MTFDDQLKSLLRLLNQLFELERRVATSPDGLNVLRQLRRMKELFEEDFHLVFEDPIGQTFNETRTDVEGRLAGGSADDLVIVETIKPIIRSLNGPTTFIEQKGIVIASARSEQDQ